MTTKKTTKVKTVKELFLAVVNGTDLLDVSCNDRMDLADFAGPMADTIEGAKYYFNDSMGDSPDKDVVTLYKLVPVKTVKRAELVVEDV